MLAVPRDFPDTSGYSVQPTVQIGGRHYDHESMSNPLRRVLGTLVLGLAALLQSGCGGGGGGASVGPALLLVTFDGATATPGAGDRLLLIFDAPVQLAAGATLDDEDLEFSGAGASLGTLTAAPTQPTPEVIQIRVGNGVSFTPGTTTVEFSEMADAIVSAGGAVASSPNPVTITNGDNDDPFIQNVTLNGIEDQLNGTGPAMGTLQVPRSGFTVDIDFLDANPIAGDLFLSADRPVTTPAGTRSAGQNFGDQLQITFAANTISAVFPANVRLPVGAVTLTARVIDLSGRISLASTFDLLSIEATNAVRPFEMTQLWFLDTSRDIESFSPRTFGGGNVGTLDIVSGANGLPDLDDALAAIGLRATMANATDATVRAQLLQVVLDELAILYDGVSIDFTLTQPSTPFPTSSGDTVPFNSFSYSQICLAGAPNATGSGTLGAAIVDPNNGRQVNDCNDAFQTQTGPIRLGVFVHTFVDLGFLSGPGSEFRTTFDPFTPIFGGQPIGDVGGDDTRLSGALTDPRATLIQNAIQSLGRAIAVVTAHECGHSMGLVVNGPMPTGLYGNDPVNFPLSSGQPPSAASNHIENQVLFPLGSQNVMSPSIDFASALDPNTGFNSLNRAYLREQVLYDPR